MNNGVKNLLIFTIGAAAGSLVTWKFVETKYAQLAQEEIDSVKEMYRRSIEESLGILEEADQAQKDYEDGVTDSAPDLKQTVSKIKEVNHVEESEEGSVEDAYVICPEEFDEFEDYEAFSLIYYKGDHVLVDEQDEIIDDVEDTIGPDALYNFDEEGYVYVRNDRLKHDYEVFLDERKSSDVIKTT